MIALHFQGSEAPLYGVFHPAATERRRRAVLILNPWGWEALRAHRSLRALADRIANAGLDCLRFDYSCSGDSTGEHDDASVLRWIADSERALEELAVLANVRRVSLVGLRLGALVAAQLVARKPRWVDRLALWEGPTNGDEFLEMTSRSPKDERSAFPVTSGFEAEVRELDLSGLDAFRGHLMVLSSRGQEIRATRVRSLEVVEPEATESPCWVEDADQGAGAIPVDTLDSITEWLT